MELTQKMNAAKSVSREKPLEKTATENQPAKTQPAKTKRMKEYNSLPPYFVFITLFFTVGALAGAAIASADRFNIAFSQIS